MCQYYYRVTVNDAQGLPTTEPPGDRWSYIAQLCEERGWTAKLEWQLIVEGDADMFLAGLANTQGYLRVGARVACPWEVLAEMKPRTAILIGENNAI